jgi:hypothetical protein
MIGDTSTLVSPLFSFFFEEEFVLTFEVGVMTEEEVLAVFKQEMIPGLLNLFFMSKIMTHICKLKSELNNI